MNRLSNFICFLIFSCPSMITQNLRANRRQGRPGRNWKNRPAVIDHDDKSLFQALTINYPLHIFDSRDEAKGNWRKTANYDESFAATCENDKPYSDYARAQDQEDIWLFENWFYGMKDGVIMESGALDGLLFSTSFMYEQFANWTAVHVEADPENYNNLKSNREKAINVHGALCSEPRLLHYSSVGVLPVRGFVEFMSTSFLKKWHGRIYNNKTKVEDLPTVQCLPVKSLLRELNLHHIDIWILDTEGAEESVLRGTDFSQVQINAVAMECDQHDIMKNQRKTDILEANGFQCILVERNCMCKNRNYVPHTAKSMSALRKWDGQKWSAVYAKDIQWQHFDNAAPPVLQ